MNKTIKRLLITTIVLHTTQPLKIGDLPLSIFQIMIIISTATVAIDILRGKRIKTGLYLLYAIVGIVSSVIAFFISTNREWAESNLLLGIMVSLFVIMIVNYFDHSDINNLSKAIIHSQYITIPLSIYTVIMDLVNQRRIIDIKISFMIWPMENAGNTLGHAGRQLRLWAPYNTGPILSVVMSMCILILYFNKDLYKKRVRYILIVTFIIIFILTGSRTGLAGLAVVLLFVILSRTRINTKTFINLVVIGLIGLVLFLSLFETTYIQLLIKRLSIANIMEDRHFLVPLDGIIIWLGSLKNFFIGIGFGSSANMMGAHTYLPPHFLCNFVTLVAERGIAGFVIVIILVMLMIHGFNQIKYNSNYTESAIWMALNCGLISGIFYENLNCYLLIMVLAICFMIKNDRRVESRKIK